MKKLFQNLFGTKGPAAIPLADSRLNERITTLVPSWIVEETASLPDLIDVARKLAPPSPDHRLLVSLDDLGQALYTSTHAVQTHDLDAISDAEIETLPPECFDDEGYIHYFSTPAEFPFRLRNLAREEAQMDWQSLHESLSWDDAEGRTIADVTATPSLVLNGPTLIQQVPVRHGWEALAALPNGYFTCDWSPFATRAVARHLETAHGAALCGVGASWLAFDMADVTDPSGLAQDICALYQGPPDAVQTLEKALRSAPFAMLRYTE